MLKITLHMSTLLMAAASLAPLLLTGCGPQVADERDDAAPKPTAAELGAAKAPGADTPQPLDRAQARVFRVEGMTCSGCEHHVRTAVGELAGVEGVEASATAERVWVAGEDADEAAILAAITGAGYKASLPAASQPAPADEAAAPADEAAAPAAE